MNIRDIVNYLIIIFAVLDAITILLQVRGSGLGSVFGSIGSEFYRSRRGIEKLLFNGTVLFTILFVISCIGSVIINS